MIGIDAVCRLVADLEPSELERWIAESWVLPERSAEGYVFHEVDVARIHLIVEMRHELAINDEAMPLVLRLLDQLYALRRRVKSLTAAIEGLPPEIRDRLSAHLGDQDG